MKAKVRYCWGGQQKAERSSFSPATVISKARQLWAGQAFRHGRALGRRGHRHTSLTSGINADLGTCCLLEQPFFLEGGNTSE